MRHAPGRARGRLHCTTLLETVYNSRPEHLPHLSSDHHGLPYPVETIVMATTAAGPRTAPDSIGPATGGVLLSWRPRGAPRHARRTHHRVDLPFCSTRTCVPSYCSFADRSDTDAFIQIVPMKAWFDLGRDIGIGASGLMR